jgi:glutathione synthase/RimK-type ligase-like ATP-grasp enzyme
MVLKPLLDSIGRSVISSLASITVSELIVFCENSVAIAQDFLKSDYYLIVIDAPIINMRRRKRIKAAHGYRSVYIYRSRN